MEDVTLSELESVARRVRKNYSDVHGQCYPASKELLKTYASEFGIDRGDMEVIEVRMGDSGTIRHYVVAFPARRVSDSSAAGRIMVDITLDQYCDAYKESGKVETSIGPKSNIPNVIISETLQQSPYTG